ncbi:MAG TPA: zf-TFIIB domain-containing protein [Gemmataceae bacterium]|jgi:Zn-finger nucleic acid-binding protein|nr:zf-TFIIB domain-containing protein [Gemmataceae bacterium]
MQCPVCNTTLLVTNRQGVEIDHCPRCRGVWLDRGELDKLIERSVGYRGDDDSGEYEAVGRRDDHRPYPAKRKEGFWQKMFDFD